MKATDIRPEQAMSGQKEAMDADVAWLLKRKDEFVEVSCPACDAAQAELAFERKGFSYWRCSSCGTVYTNPRPTPEVLGQFYANSEVYKYWGENVYEASADNRRRLLFRPRAELLVERCRDAGLSGGAMIEVGSSRGFFCEEVQRLDFFDRIVGIEPTPDQAQACRDKGFEVYEESYELAQFDFLADAIASFETIEHLFSPKAFMEWAWGRLNPGGILMLTCPNIKGFETLVLGPESGAVDHEHLNYFSPESLRILAERTGFTDVVATTPGRLDVEIVQEAFSQGAVGVADMDPFIVELVTRQDNEIKDLFQKFLQQSNLSSSMMIVARRTQ